MRCQICGKIIAGQPITRKTCCVNKMYIFCSDACLRRWTQTWLRHQEQIPSGRAVGGVARGALRRTEANV